MALSKIQAESMNLADTYAFTGTVSGAGGGKLLQVVNSTFTTDSGTITASGDFSIGTIAITPSATTSKIFIIAQSVIEIVTGSNGIVEAKIFRDQANYTGGTEVGRYYNGIVNQSSGQTHYFTADIACVDSPNTTSSTTYIFTIGRGSGGTTSVRSNTMVSHFTVFEIGA